jgi:hypothetical protein
MSAQIGQRVFATGAQEYISLKRDEYIRLLPIANNWSRIRVGILWAIDASASITATTINFGLCSYPYGFTSYQCQNYVGFGLSADSTMALTYNAGAAPYFTSTFTYFTIRTGFTAAGSTGGSSLTIASNTGTPQRRTLTVLDVTKGSASQTISGSHSAALVVQDWSYQNLMEAVSQFAYPAVVAGNTMTSVLSDSRTVSEITGPLNAVSVSWNKLEYALEVYSIAAFRVT